VAFFFCLPHTTEPWHDQARASPPPLNKGIFAASGWYSWFRFLCLKYTSDTSNIQHSQKHASGFQLSTSASNNDSPTSDNLQYAPGLELSISTLDHISNNDSPTSGNSQYALQNAPHTFNNTTNIGSLTVKCTYCNALRFPGEATGLCYANGKVVLDPFPQLLPWKSYFNVPLKCTLQYVHFPVTTLALLF